MIKLPNYIKETIETAESAIPKYPEHLRDLATRFIYAVLEYEMNQEGDYSLLEYYESLEEKPKYLKQYYRRFL